MSAGLLVGFQYEKWEKYRLPVVFDLYLAYRHLRAALGPEAPLLVVTDAGRGEGLTLVHEEDLTAAVSAGAVDGQIIPFADFLLGAPHADRRLLLYHCSSRSDLERVGDFFQPYSRTQNKKSREEFRSKLFIYYSGHGEEESILLPSLEKMVGEDFLTWALSHRARQLFCLADCCRLGSCRLPYRFDALAHSPTSCLRPPPSCEYRFRRERTALLLSSETDAHGDNFGSFFTRSFFAGLGAGVSRWEQLLQPKAALYSSYPEGGKIWPWITTSCEL